MAPAPGENGAASLTNTASPSPTAPTGIAADGTRVAATNLMLAAVSFVSSVLVAQYFGDEGRGVLSLVFLWPALLIGVANLGMPHAALFFASKNPEDRARWVGTASVLSLLSGSAVGLAGFFAVEFLLPDDRPVVLWPARLMMLGLIVRPLIGTTIHPWLGLGRIARWNRLRTLVDLVPLVFVLLLIAMGSKSLTTLAIIHLVLFGSICLLSLRSWRGTGLCWDRSAVRPILRYGLPTALSVIPFTLSFRIDQAFLATNQSDAALGHYVVAAGWSMSVLPVLNTLASLAWPRVMSSDAAPSTVVDHVRFTVFVALGLALVGGGVSPFVVPLVFGQDFSQSGRLALVLLPATTILGLSTVMEELLRALNRPRSPLYAQLAGLTVTLSLLWWVTPRYGVWGAAGVSAAAYSVAAGWSTLAIARTIDVAPTTFFAIGKKERLLTVALIRRTLRPIRRLR